MPYKILISRRATVSLEEILDYTLSNFGNTVRNKLLDKIEKTIYTVSIHPLLFSEIKPTIHRVLIINEISMFYQVKEKTIRILLFWNNRQNPKQLKL